MSSPAKRTKVSKTKVEVGGTGDSKVQFFPGESYTISARVHQIHRWTGVVFVTFDLNPAKRPNRNGDNSVSVVNCFMQIFAYPFLWKLVFVDIQKLRKGW